MSSLHKRATPPQAMLLRIVEGSIKNVCDAHGQEFDPYFARSVAKRAAGTLSAAMPAVLAAKPSEKPGIASQVANERRAARQAQLRKSATGSQVTNGPEGAGSLNSRRLPALRLLEKWMVRQMRDIKLSGNTERAQAFIDVLRQVSKLKE